MATATVQLNIRIPEELRADVAALASDRRTSINHEVTTAIRAHLDAAKEGKQK